MKKLIKQIKLTCRIFRMYAQMVGYQRAFYDLAKGLARIVKLRIKGEKK